MNERIKELAGKALDQAVPQTWTTLTAYDLDKFTKKLAELIVAECIEISSRLGTPDSKWISSEISRILMTKELKPCKSPYCECDIGKFTHPGYFDNRS